MKRFLTTRAKIISAMIPLLCAGCDGEIKAMLIDQGIGFLSAISAAAATSLIQQLFGTGA